MRAMTRVVFGDCFSRSSACREVWSFSTSSPLFLLLRRFSFVGNTEESVFLFHLVLRNFLWWETCSICLENWNGRPTINGAKTLVSPETIQGFYKKSHKWEWIDTDILHLNVAGTNIIVIGTYQAAVDLLEKKSSIYSGRYCHFNSH